MNPSVLELESNWRKTGTVLQARQMPIKPTEIQPLEKQDVSHVRPGKTAVRINAEASRGNPGHSCTADTRRHSQRVFQFGELSGMRYIHTFRPPFGASSAVALTRASDTGNSRLTSQLPGVISAQALVQARSMLSGR